MTDKKPVNREAWLTAFAIAVQPWFTEAGLKYPEKYRISCGFPGGGGRERVGECWFPTSSGDGSFEVFVSPVYDDTIQVAQVVVHELLHACLPHKAGHGTPFKRAMPALNLTGKATATVPDDKFAARVQSILDQLGPYPHAKLVRGGKSRRTQSTRLLKVECSNCGYTVRVTRKWLDAAGPPLCPDNECDLRGEPMEVA